MVLGLGLSQVMETTYRIVRLVVAVKSMGGTISRFEEERMDLQRVFLKLIEESA